MINIFNVILINFDFFPTNQKGKGDLPPEDAIQSESNKQWPINITGQDAPGYIVNVTIYCSSLADAKAFHASLIVMSTESMCKYFCLFKISRLVCWQSFKIRSLLKFKK